MERPKATPWIGERIRAVDSGLYCLALNPDGISPIALAQLGSHPKKVQATARACRTDIRVGARCRAFDRPCH